MIKAIWPLLDLGRGITMTKAMIKIAPCVLIFAATDSQTAADVIVRLAGLVTGLIGVANLLKYRQPANR